MDYNELLKSIRSIIQFENTPLKLVEGRWIVKDRLDLVNQISPRLFDVHLDTFKECAIEVLKEINPELELPPEERYAAVIHGKTPRYSRKLRESIAEFLAILGNIENPKNCSRDKAELTSCLTVREIFKDSDWRLWGSLNDLLPILAEANPRAFTYSVTRALQSEPCPFNELFSQEGVGIAGRNYLTGLLWGLEKLAWHEDYVVLVTSVLGEIATHDPGGNWSNRAINSISTLLLPWHPQTNASIEKRIACIKSLQADFPDIAWKVVLTLLPNQHQTSSGNSKPTWINPLPDDYKVSVTHKDYWKQVNAYSNIAVEMAEGKIEYLTELVNHLDNLPQEIFDKAIESISQDTIIHLEESQQLPIWIALTDFVVKHRKYSDASWSLNEDYLAKIDTAIELLKPVTPHGIALRIFGDRDFNLYEKKSDFKEQRESLNEKRIELVKNILEEDGIDGIISFISLVKNPDALGQALGAVNIADADQKVIPQMFFSDSKNDIIFSNSYSCSRWFHQGCKWVENTFSDEWNTDQKLAFLFSIPDDPFIWNRLEVFLGEEQNLYWEGVDINPYAIDDISLVIPKLLEAKRGIKVIYCLDTKLRNGEEINLTVAKNALMTAVGESQALGGMDSYHITNLIKHLQSSDEFSEQDLFEVEWAYLSLLDRHGGEGEGEPKTLYKRLSTTPNFYSEVISILYKSKKENVEPADVPETIISNSWKLLHNWNRPPGLNDDDSFDDKKFTKWYQDVLEICAQTGHTEIAKIKIGEVLFYTPPDPNGLWINQVVATTLNGIGSEDLLSGFGTEIYNSRGVHWLDPTGQPELDLAEEWLSKANDLDALGLARFSAKLRQTSESYKRDAERLIAEYSRE